MFETAGAPTLLEPAASLVWLVLLPLLGALGRGPMRTRAAIAASGGLFALAVWVAVRLALLPPGRALAQAIAPIARVGQLDLALDLVVDAPSAACVVLGAALALAEVLHAVWTQALHRLPWILLLAAAAQIVAIVDALPLVGAGFALASVGGWGLARGEPREAIGALVASDAAIVLGAVTSFWALGGTFSAGGYAPDAQPRFAVVTLTNAAALPGRATVSMTTYAGALAIADDGPPLPGEPWRAPFTATLDPGTYSFRIQAGAASQDTLVSHVTLSAGRAYALSPFGATVSLRNLGDQARVPSPAIAGEHAARWALTTRSLLGARVVTILGLLLVGGALLRLARIASGGALAIEALPVFALALRVGPLVDPGPAFAFGVALVGAVLAARAAAEADGSRALGGVLAANVAIAVAIVLGGEPGAGLVVAVASLLAASSWIVGAGDARWLGVAAAAATGAIPAAGASTGIAAGVASLLGAHEIAVAFTILVATALAAFAAFRVYRAQLSAPARGGAAPAPVGAAPARALAAAFAALAIAAGVALGAGTSPFGGRTVPLIRRVVSGSAAVEAAPKLAFVALLASFAVVAAGVAASKGTGRLPWLAAPSVAAERAGHAVGAAIAFLSRGARALERDAIEHLTVALGGGFLRAGAALRRVEQAAADRSAGLWDSTRRDKNIGRGERASSRVAGADARVRDWVLLGMMVLLALVVLSSTVLGR